MKTAAFAAALLLSGAALAQTHGSTETHAAGNAQSGVAAQADVRADPATDPVDERPGHDMPMHDRPMHEMSTHGMTTQPAVPSDSATQDVTAQGAPRWSDTAPPGTLAANDAAAGDAIVQPSNADPERDARGIAVLSDPATVPAGYNGIAATAVGGPLVDPATGEAADEGYPPCTASVTDNCLQTYERGRRPQ